MFIESCHPPAICRKKLCKFWSSGSKILEKIMSTQGQCHLNWLANENDSTKINILEIVVQMWQMEVKRNRFLSEHEILFFSFGKLVPFSRTTLLSDKKCSECIYHNFCIMISMTGSIVEFKVLVNKNFPKFRFSKKATKCWRNLSLRIYELYIS